MSKKILEIIMNNIKGQKTVQKLTGKDIICGPNGVGKTTRLQALGISLLGYVPGQGKKPEETFKHSSSDVMEVGLKTEDFSFTREFKKKSSRNKDGSTKVSIQQSVNVSPSKSESKLAEKEARILAELGNFPVMLDFNEFLNLSDSKRREFIYNLAGFKSEEWTKDRVERYLEDKLLTMELEVNNPEQYEILKEIISDALAEYPDNYDINMGLQSMIDWAKVKLSSWNDEKKKSESAAKKLAELKNQLTDTDRDLKVNKEELEKLQDQLIKCEKQISEDTQKKRNIDLRLSKIEKLQADIAAEQAKVCEINSVEISETIKNLKASMKPAVDNTEKLKSIDNEIADLQAQEEKLLNDKDEVKEKGIKLKAQIETTQNLLDKVKDVGGTCVLDKRIKCDKDFSKFISFTEKEIKTWSIQRDILADTYKEIISKENQLNDKYKQLALDKKAIEQEEIKLGRDNNLTNSQINTLESQMNYIKSFDSLKAEKIKNLQADLEKLQAEKIDPIAPIETLIKQSDGIKGQISTLKIKIQEEEEARITLSNLKSSMIDSKKADYYSISFKSLNEALGAKGLQGELMKETLEPMQNEIQANLNSMGVDNKFYFNTESESGKEIFQFGWKDKFGEKRNFDALSTGQQMILLIAMLTTFIVKSNPNTKVLAIDNIENLDSDNLKKVIAGLNKISDKLDNIILSGVIGISSDEGSNEGFKVWHLAEEGEINEQSA